MLTLFSRDDRTGRTCGTGRKHTSDCQELDSLKLTYPLKISLPKRKVAFQSSIFSGYASFREGNGVFFLMAPSFLKSCLEKISQFLRHPGNFTDGSEKKWLEKVNRFHVKLQESSLKKW